MMLFNHGISPGELFINVKTSVTKKDIPRNLKNHRELHESIGIIFANAFKIIIDKLLDDKLRFLVPGTNAYIDFDVVTGESFKAFRKIGRFLDVDFIESDFTGYSLRYYFKLGGSTLHKPLYVGGALKEKFYERINRGEKFYSIRDFVLDDVMDKIADTFPYIEREELKRLILIGFKRIHRAILFGAPITIRSTAVDNCVMFIGYIKNVPKAARAYYIKSRNLKERLISKWREDEFEGFYYVCIPKSKILDWVKLNFKTTKTLKFQNLVFKKLEIETHYTYHNSYIFKIFMEEGKYSFYCKDIFSTRYGLYHGEIKDKKFIPATETWQELKTRIWKESQ